MYIIILPVRVSNIKISFPCSETAARYSPSELSYIF